MYCTQCGHPITGSFCSNCGAANTPSSAVTTAVAPIPSATASATAPIVQKTDDMAIVSLILGILSMVAFSIFAGIPAVILGHKSRGRIRRSMGTLTGDGVALAGLIMGYLSFLAIPFILIIAAIAIPNLLRARIAANEAAAVGSISTINMAEVSYATDHQQEGFTCSLGDLKSAGVDSMLASGMKSGYRYELVACDGTPVQHYTILAMPITPGNSGRKTFCSDESGVVKSMATDATGNCMDVGEPLHTPGRSF
jgi:type IV pilus assembly protein PilA